MTRLVNRAHDCLFLSVGQLFQELNDSHSCEAIKSRRWLVKNDALRVSDQLDTDRGPLTLPSRDELLHRGATHSVCTVL